MTIRSVDTRRCDAGQDALVAEKKAGEGSAVIVAPSLPRTPRGRSMLARASKRLAQVLSLLA